MGLKGPGAVRVGKKVKGFFNSNVSNSSLVKHHVADVVNGRIKANTNAQGMLKLLKGRKGPHFP